MSVLLLVVLCFLRQGHVIENIHDSKNDDVAPVVVSSTSFHKSAAATSSLLLLGKLALPRYTLWIQVFKNTVDQTLDISVHLFLARDTWIGVRD